MIEKQEKNYTVRFGSDTQFGESQFGTFDHYNYTILIERKEIDIVFLIKKLVENWKNI